MSATQPLTGDELATIKARVVEVQNWPEFPKVYALATEDVLRLVAEIERLQAQVDALAQNYGVRAKHAPTPLAQWADIEADLRRVLNQ